LEETVFDSNCSELVIDHVGDIGNPTSFMFTKLSKHKLLRVAFGGQEYSTVDSIIHNRIIVTVGTLAARTLYSGTIANDQFVGEQEVKGNYGPGYSWFDISNEPDGNLTVNVAEGGADNQSRFYFQAFANAF
jgi:hypothetical protein